MTAEAGPTTMPEAIPANCAATLPARTRSGWPARLGHLRRLRWPSRTMWRTSPEPKQFRFASEVLERHFAGVPDDQMVRPRGNFRDTTRADAANGDRQSVRPLRSGSLVFTNATVTRR